MRRAARRDANEAEIVDALLKAGATVQRLNDPALPDLLVGYRGQNFLLEVKALMGTLTETQLRWWYDVWQGQRVIIRVPEEALCAIGATECQNKKSHISPTPQA